MPAAYDASTLKSTFEQINKRLRAIEAQLQRLSDEAGIDYEQPGEGIPPEVIELAVDGKQLEAIKLYRELTQADFQTAKTVIEGI